MAPKNASSTKCYRFLRKRKNAVSDLDLSCKEEVPADLGQEDAIASLNTQTPTTKHRKEPKQKRIVQFMQ